MNTAASLEKGVISVVRNPHVQLHVQGQKRMQIGLKAKMKLGLQKDLTHSFYQTSQDQMG